MSDYPYSRPNLFEEPHRYMYTPFEGIGFFRAYLADRESLRARLVGSGEPDEPPRRKLAVLPALPGEREFETRALLLDLRQERSQSREWLNALVRLYEVSKRLFTRYSSGLEPLSSRYDLLDNYALFSELAINGYRETLDLRYLNAALKLNDLLGSVDFDEAGPVARYSARSAVEGELAAVRQLLDWHAVAP